jgi:hypothetical protein
MTQFNRGGNGRNADDTWPKTDGYGCPLCGAMGTGGHGGGCPNMTKRMAPYKRETWVVEREAQIVEVLAGGPLTTPGIASVLANKQQPSRSMIAMVTQSLINLEHDGIVKRDPLLTGRRHWRLAK